MRNELKNLVPQDVIRLAAFCAAAMAILNARGLTLLGLLMCFSLFGWAAWKADYVTLLAACAFSVLVFLPLQKMQATVEVKPSGENNVEVS